MVLSLLFEGIYISLLHLTTGTYLLTIPSVITEAICMIKSMKRCKDDSISKSLVKSKCLWRYSLCQPLRAGCYIWMLFWTMVVEITYEGARRSLLAGFIPIASYSGISLGIDFFLTAPEKVYSLYISLYKALRLVFFVQLISLESSIQMKKGKLDTEDLSHQLWTIQIGTLIISPVIGCAIIYYSYYLVSRLISPKKEKWDKRHLFTYAWIILATSSLIVVAVLSLKFKNSVFEKSGAVLTYLSVASGLIFVNLVCTVLMRSQLE